MGLVHRLALVLITVSGLVLSGLAALPAQAVTSTTEVFVLADGGTREMFISTRSGQEALDSDNDLLVDVFHDRVEITERSPEGLLVVSPSQFQAPGCSSPSADKVVCTGAYARIATFSRAGDDTVTYETVSDGGPTLSVDCGDGGRDGALINNGTASSTVPGVEEVVGCELISYNGNVLQDTRDPEEEEPEPDPFAVESGLVKVPVARVTHAPKCDGGRKTCGGFTFTTEAAARAAILRSGLNVDLNVVRLTTDAKVLAILKPFKKKKVVDTITNYTDGDVIAQSEVLYDGIYQRFNVDKRKHRASTPPLPYTVTLKVFSPPVPDPPGACPYKTGVYSDVQPGAATRRYDIEAELKGTTPEFALQKLEKNFGCTIGDVIRTPVLDSTADAAAVTRIDFDRVAKEVTVRANVPARSDLLVQVSGRSRSFWLDNPARAEDFDAELGPLVDGTFALAPGNLTTVNVRLFERSTGRAVLGLGTIQVLDKDGRLVAQQTANGVGDSTLTMSVRTLGELRFVASVPTANGRTLSGFARRKVVNAGPVVVTARGAVLSRVSEEAPYAPDSTTPLGGDNLVDAVQAVDLVRAVVQGAPDETAARQARVVIEMNESLRTSRPAAILRQVHQVTGFELASLHLNRSTSLTDEQALARPVMGGLVLTPLRVTQGSGFVGQFVSSFRPAVSGITAGVTGPVVTLLGGSFALGLGRTGGVVGAGDWIVDQPPARSTSARGAFDWFLGPMAAVSSAVGATVAAVARAAAAGAATVAKAFTGGSKAPEVVRVNNVDVTITPGVKTVPDGLAINAGPIAPAQIASIPLVPGTNLTDAQGNRIMSLSELLANDGASLLPPGARLSADGTRLLANDGASLIANDGASLIANDGASLVGNAGGTYRLAIPTSLISDHGAGLVSDNGGGIVSNNSGALVPGGVN